MMGITCNLLVAVISYIPITYKLSYLFKVQGLNPVIAFSIEKDQGIVVGIHFIDIPDDLF